jgi:hypothetical protein
MATARSSSGGRRGSPLAGERRPGPPPRAPRLLPRHPELPAMAAARRRAGGVGVALREEGTRPRLTGTRHTATTSAPARHDRPCQAPRVVAALLLLLSLHHRRKRGPAPLRHGGVQPARLPPPPPERPRGAEACRQREGGGAEEEEGGAQGGGGFDGATDERERGASFWNQRGV